jgi:hypothetical protein
MKRGTFRGIEGQWITLPEIEPLLKDEAGNASWEQFVASDSNDQYYFRADERPERFWGVSHWAGHFYIVPPEEAPTLCPVCEQAFQCEPDYLCQGCRYGNVIDDASSR